MIVISDYKSKVIKLPWHTSQIIQKNRQNILSVTNITANSTQSFNCGCNVSTKADFWLLSISTISVKFMELHTFRLD